MMIPIDAPAPNLAENLNRNHYNERPTLGKYYLQISINKCLENDIIYSILSRTPIHIFTSTVVTHK